MSNIYWEEHKMGEHKEPEKQVATISMIEAPKKNVGGYDITGNHGGPYSVMFMMTKKPKWFHRVCTRFFLGWNWVDEK